MNYAEFLKNKVEVKKPSGFDVSESDLNKGLYAWQKPVVRWAVKQGRAAIFEDCGLGKTIKQLEWARLVSEERKGRVIILAPLAVGQQTVAEARKFGLDAHFCTSQERADFIEAKIVVTNYEKLHLFDPSVYVGVVLDESSILKSFMGKTKRQIISAFEHTPYKLACTATPAPNDSLELGNHSEFLDVLPGTEMISRYFINDSMQVGHYRLKGHAQDAFWRWMSSWSVMIRKPSDIGYDDAGYILPELKINRHIIESDRLTEGYLFAMPATTLTEQRKVKRNFIKERCELLAKMVNKSKEPWVIWCELNDEGGMLEEMIKDSVQIAGADSLSRKEEKLVGFSTGETSRLISKASICGWGLNWQHCNKMAFVNLTHSYEQLYQAIRRCWRFGQKKPVDVNLFLMDTETPILDNISRKQNEADSMAENMARYMKDAIGGTLKQKPIENLTYNPSQEAAWKLKR